MRSQVLTIILCAVTAVSAMAQQQINVLSSASMFADMAAVIGGDKVTVRSIVPIGGDPHIYDPKPSDAQKVMDADVILINGLTFEGWVAKLIKNSGTTAHVATITEGVDAIQSEEYENSYDPHAWMAADNGLIYVDNITKALIAVAPQHKESFENNAEQYKTEISQMHVYIQEQIKKIPAEQRVLITSHDAFAYFGNTYGLQLNALKGISTEEETQTSDMVRVANAIKTTGVKAIFVESTINPKMIQQIAVDNGVVIGGELYADSLGPKGSSGDTYLKMLKHNCDVIVNALSASTVTDGRRDQGTGSSSLWVYALLGVVMLGALAFLVSKFK